MKVGIMLPVGEWGGERKMGGWADIRSIALHAEAEGLDSLWVADHLLSGRGAGEPRGIHEGWTLLSAVAAITSRVELGTLVVCSSFRNPGVVAKIATTADLVSGGRLILGLGAGYYDREYEAFGFPTDHRVSRFAEALDIITRLLRGDRVTFEGRYYTLRDALLLPPPERRIPVLVAAHRPRMMRLTARLADAWATAWYEQPDAKLQKAVREFDAALAAEDRDPSEVARTIGLIVHADGTSDQVAAGLEAFRQLGFLHAVVHLGPLTRSSISRLAEAVRLSRG